MNLQALHSRVGMERPVRLISVIDVGKNVLATVFKSDSMGHHTDVPFISFLNLLYIKIRLAAAVFDGPGGQL